jgi:shikimate dehydrogenase
LGNGGAAKAVFYGLQQLGIDAIYVSREKTSNKILTYSELSPELMETHTIIVNCTPVGMWPNVDDCPAIPYQLLTDKHLLYDLLYNPNETLFMKKGEEQGASVKNGLEMLLLQAFAGWTFWRKN